MIEIDSKRTPGKTGNQRQFRNAIIVFAVLEFIVLMTFVYLSLR